MRHRCRHTTRQACASGGFSSPVLKDLGAQLKYYPDSWQRPIDFAQRSPCCASRVGVYSQTLGTQETERTMPYIVVLAVTLLLVAGSVLFVRTPARQRKPPVTR